MAKQKIKSGHILVSAFVVLITFVAVTGIWAVLITQQGPLEEETMFTLEKGTPVSIVAENLKAEGVVRSPFLFKLSAWLMFAEKNLQAGVYKFSKQVSLRDVIKYMARGQTVQFKVTIPEGLRAEEVVEILKKSPHLKGDFNNIDLSEQNPILPETYMYSYDEDVKTLVLRMQESMQKALNQAWESRQSGLPLKNKQELLILASIVEKETSLDSERAEIAGVFINRLNKGMRLQSDPTVIYGLKNYDGNIRKKDLRTNHPYNTYVHKGLPIGPIAMPGLASLMAVAQPNATENLYFVADLSGGHVFAKTHDEHQNNVKSYLKKYREFILNRK